MKELSLHILDIAKNSVKANASLIEIDIDENQTENYIRIKISDNGCGMSPEFLKAVKDPFFTTRKTRKVGMGLSLFEAAAVQCGGGLDINSELNVGTTVFAWFEYNSIDRAPIGNMASTMAVLISGSPKTDFVYIHKINGKEFVFKTEEIKQILGDVPLDLPEIVLWIEEYIAERLDEISKL